MYNLVTDFIGYLKNVFGYKAKILAIYVKIEHYVLKLFIILFFITPPIFGRKLLKIAQIRYQNPWLSLTTKQMLPASCN
jgi:hypothetical protein